MQQIYQQSLARALIQRNLWNKMQGNILKLLMTSTIIEQKIENIEDEISVQISDKNASNISEQISELVIDGKFSQTGVWK